VLKINDSESINKLNVVDENNLNNLYKYLKLYKTLKISNLTLYNTKGILHNYENVEEILEDFYHYRLEKYEERRLNLIEKYEKDKSYYNNMIRFIELVISNNKIFKMEEDKLIEYLIKNNIKKHNNSFDYVLGMSFKQLTLANMNNMIKKVKDINDIIKELNIKTKKDLWLDDLEHCK
jgi:DNA topoisomerase-2